MKKCEFFDSVGIALLIALAIGFGIAVHEVFIVVAFVVAIIALIKSVFHARGECIDRVRYIHWYP